MRVVLPARGGRSGARALAATVGLVLALGTVGCSGADDDPEASDRSPAPEASPSSSPTAPPAPGEEGTPVPPDELPAETLEAVEEGSDDYFAALTDVLGDPDEIDPTETESLPGVTGPALEEMLNTLTEYQVNGWRVEGRARVVSQEVVRATQDPESVVVRACVDNSEVRVVDGDGDELPNSRPPHPRTRNVLTLVREGEGWVVAAMRPATRPNC